jgi:CIC family chloride channel protein
MKFDQIWKIKVLRRLNKQNIDEDTLYFALTLVVGVCSGLVAVFIHKSVDFLTHFIGTNQKFTTDTFWMAGLLVLASGFITTRKFSSTSGSGIPGVKIAIVVYHGTITFWSTLAKIITSVFSLASGFSLGREGPTIAASSGMASTLGNLFSLSKAKVKSLVAIGAAGGIAAAFNTPIAAVIFALEEIVGNLNNRMLGSMIISTVVASVTASFFTDNQPVFTPLEYSLTDNRELFIYLLIGIIAAFVGPLWVRFIIKLREWHKKIFKGHKLTIIGVTFILVAIVSQFKYSDSWKWSPGCKLCFAF